MEYKSLGKIIVDVLAARKWWNSIGISTDGTRLDEIEHYLDEVLNPTTLEANPFRDDPLGTDAYYALSDGAGFGRIAAELSRFPSHQLPRQTLRDVLKGSLAASKEDRDPTTDPRNKFVELELAAHCSAAGFSVIGFDDLKFEFEGQLYIVECKRPSHSGTLDRNMESAYRQVRTRLGDSSARGLVAVAVEKVFELDQRFREVESNAECSQFGLAIGKEFSERVIKFQRSWLDPRVVGVVAIIRFLAKMKRPDLVAYSYQIGVVKFASEYVGQHADSQRLERMIAALRS